MTLTKAHNRMIEGAMISVIDYGADPTGVSDSTAAINAAFEAARTSTTVRRASVSVGNPVFFKTVTVDFGSGKYLVTGPLWAGHDNDTSSDISQCVTQIRGQGAVIFAQTNGKPVIDLTGAFGVRMTGVSIFGSETNPPNIGILLARSGSSVPNNPSAGAHRFQDVAIQGLFTLACVYDYASEINSWVNCVFWNVAGEACYFATCNNANKQITSDFTTIDTTYQSSYGDFYTGCTFNSATTDSGILTTGAVYVAESLSYGPTIQASYLDGSAAVNIPYFRFTIATGETGTSAITQSPRIIGNTFEGEDVTIVEIEGAVNGFYMHANSMPVPTTSIPHVRVASGVTAVGMNVQPFDGGVFNTPTRIQEDGEIYNEVTRFIALRDTFLTGYWRTEAALTLDGTWRELDAGATIGVPTTAKYLHVRVFVRGSAVGVSDVFALRGDSTTPAAEQFEAQPSVVGIPQSFEGIVPVIDGKIEYNGTSNLDRARIFVRGYYI